MNRRLWLASALGTLCLAVRGTAADEEQPSFAITNVTLLDSEAGYPIPANSIFFPGERVYLQFNVDGFSTDEDYRLRVSYRMEFQGASGAPFAMAEMGEISTEVYPQDEDWLPVVRAAPRIPPHAESGEYVVKLSATDKVARRDATYELAVRVEGEGVETRGGLAVRSFTFREGEDGEPVALDAYRRGQTVWGSFYITGFALAEDNSFDVESTLEVRSPEDEPMYRFQPAGDEGSPYYPRRWLPARFRIDLDRDIPAGRYTIHLVVRDKIGEQTRESEYGFLVR